MKHKFRAALLGLGNIGWRFDNKADASAPALTHAAAYLKHDRFELVAGCSTDRKDCRDFHAALGVPAYDSLEEMLDQAKPDILSICSPSQFHFEHTLQCLERGVPMIWLEKPPVSQVSELDKLLEKQRTLGNRSQVLVNFQRRYSENYRLLKKIFAEQEIGGCKAIQLTYSRGLELNGSHILDAMFFVLGDASDYDLEWVSKTGNHENPSFSMRFKEGLRVIVTGIDLSFHCIDISLIGENGRSSVLHGGMTIRHEQKIANEFYAGFYRLADCSDIVSADKPESAFSSALDDILFAFENDGKPCSNLSTARHTQVLIELVRKQQKLPN